MNFERLVGGAIFISWDMFSLKSKIGKKTRKRQERWKSKIRQNTTYQISVRNSSLTPRPRWFFVGRLTLWNFASSHWIRHGSIFLIKVGVFVFFQSFQQKAAWCFSMIEYSEICIYIIIGVLAGGWNANYPNYYFLKYNYRVIYNKPLNFQPLFTNQ